MLHTGSVVMAVFLIPEGVVVGQVFWHRVVFQASVDKPRDSYGTRDDCNNNIQADPPLCPVDGRKMVGAPG